MSVAITIGGDVKTHREGSLQISAAVNGRTTASFAVRSNDGSYRPELDEEVIIEETSSGGMERLFGGLVSQPSEAGTLGDKTGAHTAISTKITTVDFAEYTERRYVNETIAAGTLKSQLQTLVTNYLADYGVTLHASQVDGPSMPAFTYSYRHLPDVLTEWMTVTAKFGDPYIWRMDHFKVLRAYQPATEAAPFNITDGDGFTVGDITVEKTRDRRNANRVIIKIPSRTETGRIESFSGDGTTTTFPLEFTPTHLYGVIHPASGGGETLGSESDPGQWVYHPATNTIERLIGPTVNGETYNLLFDGLFEGEGIAENAADIALRGIKEYVGLVEQVPSGETAQSMAEGLLAKKLVTPTTIRYRTFESHLWPGATQTIVSTLRNLNESAVITDVVIRDVGPHGRLRRDVTATVGATTPEGWRDVYLGWSIDKTGGSAGTAALTTTAFGGPAAPLLSVQHNNNGAFGGKDSFLFYRDQNSLACGGGGTAVTAASHESCQAFGYSCRIADP